MRRFPVNESASKYLVLNQQIKAIRLISALKNPNGTVKLIYE